ncbi:MAG: hypothetical protein JXR63_10480, partial [Spirochaetales bacterium]|nr:hypothetical protein [Spirochaetales bacterium]
MKNKIRTDYLAICASMLLFSLSIMLYSFIQGSDKFIQQIIRLALEIILMIFLIQDKNWAKWVLGILSIIGGALI